jgi:2-aminoadipate transaminase
VPGRAAYVDGRRGSSSMRLNFAGVPDDDIREGIRRIGKALREQVGLYGSLTGAAPAEPGRPSADAAGASADAVSADEQSPLADVVALPRRAQEDSPRRRQDR